MLLPYLTLGGAQLAVGAAAIFARFALTGSGPLAVSAARLAIAAFVLLAAAFLRRAPLGATTRRESIVLAVAGVALALHFATWIASLEYTPVAVSTLLVATSPIWTAAWDALVRKRPLARASAFAFAAGALGIVLVLGFDRTPAPQRGLEWLGDLLALAGAAAIAAYLLLVRTVRRRLDTRTIVTHTYGYAALALVALTLAARQPLPPLGNTVAWGGIFGMALISQLLGHTAMNVSLRWFTPSAVSFATLIEPVFAAGLAFLIFGEAVPPAAAAGAAIVLASVLVVAKHEREEVAPELYIGPLRPADWSGPLERDWRTNGNGACMNTLPAALAALDPDPQETSEWLEALRAVIAVEGPERARDLLEQLVREAQRGGAHVSLGLETPYVNTIPVDQQPIVPGDLELEARLRHYVRWNAMAMVVRANKTSSELGGHVATFASAATLYDVGFNHFFRAPSENFGGDMVFFQGHSSPGVYARAFLEGRIGEDQLEKFRQEVEGGGLASYPHPWLMPDFWQFPTVSMGLGPIMSIYQAHFMRYVHDRGLKDTAGRKVWAFVGDGETDEPETLGAISLAGREKLDNLIWVINCNLQRLDGPVRGNGKIIQELERVFKGAGWNVIKVIWGSRWDALLQADSSGRLVQLMNETVDGDYQTYKSRNGKYVRDEFFGRYPETAKLVEDWTDEEVWALQRGGHDPVKVYAAYKAAVEHKGQPTVILAKTIKGYGMGEAGEALNIAHQAKKMDVEEMRAFRDRFSIPVSDEQVEKIAFYRPPDDSPEMKYLRERVKHQGSLPQRRRTSESLAVPPLSSFDAQLKGTGDREISTTMAFVRILNTIARDATVGPRIVPIVADESRTFGMEGMFRQLGIYSSVGQLYHPQDAEQLMWYREDQHGQILQEGINEAGALSSFIAAGTSYSNHDLPMIPFYIFYSMFGFQRIGDLAWAAGDSRTRGFLLGGTSGRTTLNGEGLQHEDGHSQVFASFIPNCRSYDPTYGYEVAVIIQDGLRRMLTDQEDVYYYITLLNENYAHPDMPKGAEEGILRGMHIIHDAGKSDKKTARVQLLGSGAILREVIAAADLLANDWDVQSDIWSVTSFNELQRDGIAVQRENMLHPNAKPKLSFVETSLAGRQGPAIASTDYIRLYSESIRPFMGSRRYVTLGTDGYGRSDLRRRLRAFFEVNRYYVTVAALHALAQDGTIEMKRVAEAIEKYGLDPNKPNPITV